MTMGSMIKDMQGFIASPHPNRGTRAIQERATLAPASTFSLA